MAELLADFAGRARRQLPLAKWQTLTAKDAGTTVP